MKYIKIIIGSIIFFSCGSQRKSSCDVSAFKELNVYPVATVLKLPTYIVTDTIRYGDLDNIFNYKLRSMDSSLVIYIGVKFYEKNPEEMPELTHRLNSQKEQVESGQDSFALIIEKVKQIGAKRVGYLKYLDKKRNRYEGRIFFNSGKKFVDIWLFEKYSSDEYNISSTMDCILDNIEIQ